MRRSPLAILLAALVLWAGSAGATAIGPSVSIQVGDGAATDYAPDGNTYYDEQGGVLHWWLTADAQNPWAGDGYSISGFYAALKEDPFVVNNITLTNTSPVTQTFIVSVVLPIPSFPYDATIASSIGVTVTDSNGNGTVTAASVSPDGIYSGQVNGVTILSLLDPATLSCATAGCSSTVSDNTALPQLAAGPGTATSIGIVLKFTLSAFDSIGITSRFEIINVPEPTTSALLGLGALALVLARRRAR